MYRFSWRFTRRIYQFTRLASNLLIVAGAVIGFRVAYAVQPVISWGQYLPTMLLISAGILGHIWVHESKFKLRALKADSWASRLTDPGGNFRIHSTH